jgi:hypothetical protein
MRGFGDPGHWFTPHAAHPQTGFEQGNMSDNRDDEESRAIILADRLSDEPYADPDDDLRLLSRQSLRLHDRVLEAGRSSAAVLAFRLLCDLTNDLEWALDFLDSQKEQLTTNKHMAARYTAARTHLKVARLFEKCVKEPENFDSGRDLQK